MVSEKGVFTSVMGSNEASSTNRQAIWGPGKRLHTEFEPPLLEPHLTEHGALRVWLRLLSCSTLIENQVSSRLRGDFDTTLPRFDLMAQLARFPDGITMGELSQRLMVSGGNVTTITDYLEGDGLVERIAVPGDRRARIVRLTPKGRVEFDQMAEVHATWI